MEVKADVVLPTTDIRSDDDNGIVPKCTTAGAWSTRVKEMWGHSMVKGLKWKEILSVP